LTFGDELKRIGYAGDKPVGNRPLDAYFELHIEQGPILDAARVTVGIVTGGYAPAACMSTSSANAPMPADADDRRKNALIGASMLAVAVNEIGWKYHPTAGKATVPRHGLLAEQGRHPAGNTPAHLRRAPCRSGGCQPDAG